MGNAFSHFFWLKLLKKILHFEQVQIPDLEHSATARICVASKEMVSSPKNQMVTNNPQGQKSALFWQIAHSLQNFFSFFFSSANKSFFSL